ncbi:SCO3374 family protein [Streptomyces griseoluteus]|uniref:SCO3374 family protein n=1 Tax=Streptomyces griseoluteus TaxID=29306 RepID=UPI0036B799A6
MSPASPEPCGASTAPPFPRPRRLLGPPPGVAARHWYEDVLGWATAPGAPLRLVTGVRFDVLDVPAEAGAVALRRLAPASPVAQVGGRMRLLVAAGTAEELPGLLDWLEWGALALDLRALGAGGVTEAPAPPVRAVGAAVPRPDAGAMQGAAVWLRPPEPGHDVEAVLPALPSFEGVTGAPDLVRLVDTVAAQCHRVRLRRGAGPRSRGRDQPLAFS